MRARQETAISYASLDEGALVQRAREGHEGAFQLIMQRHNQRLFRIARGVLRDDAEAEDVLQQAYARAFENLDSFREEASLATWLTTITLNEARGRLRKRRANVSVDQIEAAQRDGGQIIMFNSASSPEGPESSAGRAQMRRLIEQALDDLPESFRVVFIMREIEECSVEETASNLGLRSETVKTRLHRARRLLRQALTEKIASAVADAYPFLGARCERLVRRVLHQLGYSPAADTVNSDAPRLPSPASP